MSFLSAISALNPQLSTSLLSQLAFGIGRTSKWRGFADCGFRLLGCLEFPLGRKNWERSSLTNEGQKNVHVFFDDNFLLGMGLNCKKSSLKWKNLRCTYNYYCSDDTHLHIFNPRGWICPFSFNTDCLFYFDTYGCYYPNSHLFYSS
jgi:hypothetical protein